MLFWALVFLAIPFLLPVVSLLMQSRLRRRLGSLEEEVNRQQRTIQELARTLQALRSAAPAAATPPSKPAAAPLEKPAEAPLEPPRVPDCGTGLNSRAVIR